MILKLLAAASSGSKLRIKDQHGAIHNIGFVTPEEYE
jgi:hypothetical protein